MSLSCSQIQQLIDDGYETVKKYCRDSAVYGPVCDDSDYDGIVLCSEIYFTPPICNYLFLIDLSLLRWFD